MPPPDRDDHHHHAEYGRHITSTEAERIATAAAKVASEDALNELMASFGVARGNIESMEAFKEDLHFASRLRRRDGIWADLDFLNAMRCGSVKAAARVGLTILTLLTGAFVYGMAGWLKSWLRHP